MVSQFPCQAASDKRIVELKAVLNEINGRKGGREMTIDEVSMHALLYVLALVSALCLCLRLASALLAHSPPFFFRQWRRSPNQQRRSTRTSQTTSGFHKRRTVFVVRIKINIVQGDESVLDIISFHKCMLEQMTSQCANYSEATK